MHPIVPDRRLLFEKVPHDFVQQMAVDADNMKLLVVEKAKDLGLNQAMRLQGQYRLTTTGAQQYFDMVCSGLGATARSLLAEPHEEVLAADAVPLVAGVVNKILQHRENALLQTRLIVCNARKELDGMVSSRYASITNQHIYDLFVSSCELLKFKAEFFQAALTGRDMTVVLASRRPITSVGGARFFFGTVCQNSETAGRAIRATNVLIDSETGTWSAGPFEREARIPHIRSKKLRDKMMQMSDLLAQKQLDRALVDKQFGIAMSKRVDESWDDKAIQVFKRRLTLMGETFAVSAKLIDAVVDLLATSESYRAPTRWEVYLACLSVAKKREIGRSLPLRQLAYRLVFR